MQSEFYKCYKSQLEHCIQQALREDLGTGDATTTALFTTAKHSTATLWAKAPCLIAGVELAKAICSIHNPQLQWMPKVEDGMCVETGTAIAELCGPSTALLEVERLLLNCMQRMSGIATFTHSCVERIKTTQTTLLDTRKTTPNFRYPEKWAVQIGGGQNHRMGLFDMILVKDNHIDALGGLKAALEHLERHLKSVPKPLPVVVEIRELKELEIALQFPWIDRLLLDNLPPKKLKIAVAKCHGAITTEASGNITIENLLSYAKTGVDYISMGALTYAAPIIDLSMKIH